MKIQCDVCNKEEASVFCSADEAALCDTCDRCVHHANILAGKHNRQSLFLPSSDNLPICDICQEKRGLLFCQQDRAVLCKDCDVRIHKANEHTQTHNRFLLTGVKLTSIHSSSSLSVPSINGVPRLVPSPKSSLINRPVQSDLQTPRVAEISISSTTSSISEYLIETLPGWQVEDFLDSSSTSPPNFSKTGECDLTSFWDGDLDENLSSNFLVPQAPPSMQKFSYNQSVNTDLRNTTDGKMELKENSRKRTDLNGCFNVPQLTPTFTTTSKRSRTIWY